ncbi:MAG: HDOD domain-containing protein [Dehalococcoidia bacterium]|nr:HDOD domain-containing protein [Dehalococcoidia bacterium]
MILPHPSGLLLFQRPAGLARVLLVYPDATIDDYERVTSSDLALSAQVISLANSALNRGLEPVSSVRAAVIRLRIDTTRRATALMAMCPDPDLAPTAFAAGLLHDIGRLSLATVSPPRYSAVVRRVQAGADVLTAEREQFGVINTTWG